MKMHKFFGEERFLLWAVCSIKLQVHFFEGNPSYIEKPRVTVILTRRSTNSKILNFPGFLWE